MVGGAEIIVAGGTESMSMIPMGGHKVSINPWMVENNPNAHPSRGLTAERVANRFGITRAMADEFSFNSHQKAMAAIKAGKFEDEIVAMPVSFDRRHRLLVEKENSSAMARVIPKRLATR